MKKLRIGIVGLGIGSKHIQGYREHPQADVVAICDLDEVRLAAMATKYAVTNIYQSMEKMLEEMELDVVSVATPNKFHKPLAIQALQAGCHVLCEKPMAMSAAEGEEMLAAARSVDKRLMINFSYRFTAQGRALKKRVEAGELGDIYFGRTIWHRRRGMPGFGGWFGQKALAGGGPLIDLGVHRLDLALWLMGYPQPQWVMAGTYNHIAAQIAQQQGKAFDVEDLAVGMIRFTNGAMLEVESSWAANIAEHELMETRLLGTRGGLVHRNLNETYEFEAEIFTADDGDLYDTRLHSTIELTHSAMYHFVDAIVTDTPHIATGEEGLVVMRLLDAIYHSAELGEPIRMDAPSPE